MTATTLVWFRRDLRLADNPALRQAASAGGQVVAVYVHAPDEEAPWSPGAASRWWLHHSLAALDADLRAPRHPADAPPRPGAVGPRGPGARGRCQPGGLEPPVRPGDGRARHRGQGRTARARPRVSRASTPRCCTSRGRSAPGQGGPYRVFTPFWRACQAAARRAAVPRCRRPARLQWPGSGARQPRLARPGPVAAHALGRGLRPRWQPGEDGAQARLGRVLRRVARPATTTGAIGRTSRAVRACRRTCISARSARGSAWSRHAMSSPPGRRAQQVGGSLRARARLARVRAPPAASLSADARPAARYERFARLPVGGRRTRCWRPGSAAAPAIRSWTPACANSGPPAGCTTACA